MHPLEQGVFRPFIRAHTQSHTTLLRHVLYGGLPAAAYDTVSILLMSRGLDGSWTCAQHHW